MSRFLRQATDAGVITPRAAPPEARSTRGASFARVLGATGMIVLTVLLLWLLTDESFRVTEADVRFEGLRYADEASVRAHLAGLERSPNVFRVRASEIVADLQELPEVEAASATVTVPAGVAVLVEEREPVFAWSDGEAVWLVDGEGMLFAPASELAASTQSADASSQDPAAEQDPDADQPAGVDQPAAVDQPIEAGQPVGSAEAPEADRSATVDPALLGLPIVEDERLVAEPPGIGSHLPLIDLLVMRQLLALSPEVLGSRAQALQLRVDQRDGYVLQSDRGWQAIFGHYTPTVQPTDVVPRQVQCLRWLLASEERQLERVRLAVSEDSCGTFTTFGKQG